MAKKKQSKARKFGRAVLKTLLIIVLVLLIAIQVITEANVFANILALLCGAAG